MSLSDLLSRMEGDKKDPHDAIPILFNFHSILKEHYHAFLHLPSYTYRVVTRSQNKVGGTQI